ncbi:MAG: hypothetical protein KGN97_08720 [Bacteroidota bacterium]|nr:hypothetical protein [Bacteroidota bacterium]
MFKSLTLKYTSEEHTEDLYQPLLIPNMKKLCIVLLCCTAHAFGQTASTASSRKAANTTTAPWETYSADHYAVEYPSTWELNQSRLMGTNFILFSPLENENDTFRENVNLLIQDLPGQTYDLDKIIALTEKQVKDMINNADLELSKRIETKKGPYHKLIYSGDQGKYQLKFEQYVWIIQQKAYILTLTCERNKFAAYQTDGEKILNSFSVK